MSLWQMSIAEHLLLSEFSEMVQILTILQISVRIMSEFVQNVRFLKCLSLSLIKNLKKKLMFVYSIFLAALLNPH